MTHACRYVIEFELHGGRSRNETTVAMNRGIHGHRCQSDCARRISNESNCSSVLQDFENCEIDSRSAGRSLEVTDTAKSQAIRPGIVSSTPCRYADWLQHNTGVLQYRIARPIPFERFGSHTAENTAGIDHRGERTDSRTKSATKDIRHHVGLRYEKILRSGRGTPPGNIPHPRNKFTRIASPDTINVTTPDATSSHHCPTRRRPSSGNSIASVFFVRTKTRTRTGIMDRLHRDYKQMPHTREVSTRRMTRFTNSRVPEERFEWFSIGRKNRVQSTIFAAFLWFCMYAYALAGDIEKMYRRDSWSTWRIAAINVSCGETTKIGS